MDKILTKKILGLKVEDILKCVILVVIGYCIAVMLGNCNCVEGWTCERTSPQPDNCSAEMCGKENRTPDELGIHANCNDCKGWIVDLNGDKAGIPYIRDLRFECVNEGDDFPTKDACDKWRQDKVSEYIEEKAKADKYQQGGSAPNCPRPPTPPPPAPIPQTIVCENGSCNQYSTSEAAGKAGNKTPCLNVYDRIYCGQAKVECEKNCNTPPSPPPPSPPPSPCTYTGDKRYNIYKLRDDEPASNRLTEGWWRDSDQYGGDTCNEKISNCREELRNYYKYIKGEELNRSNYNGFCLQTILGKNKDSRGDCPRKPLTTELIPSNLPSCNTKPNTNTCLDDEDQQIFITDPAVMTINDGTGDFNCKSFNDGTTYANMAWVTDSLGEDGEFSCNANCPIDNNLNTTNTNCLQCRVKCAAPYDTLGWCCGDGSGGWKTRVPVVGGGTEEITSCDQLRDVGGMGTISAIESELKNALTDF